MARWLERGVGAAAGAILTLSVPATAEVATSGPILPSERDMMQMPRTVAASDYRDSYCAKWTDGCSVCQRSTANDAPDCQPIGDAGTACNRKPVECRSLLKTTWRVCLAYTDGCNRCALGSCTLLACNRDANYQCTSPRRSHYDDPAALKLDLHGHWRLVDPQGRSCEIVVDFGIPITGKCLELGPPVAQVRDVAVVGTVFQLVRADANAPLSFATTNPESLEGIGPASGYRLERVEPMPLSSYLWEGKWRLASGGWSCDLYLSMRRHSLDSPDHAELLVPHGVSLSSGCVSPTDETKIRLRYDQPAPLPPSPDGHRHSIIVVPNEVHLPIWTSWQVEGHEITFRDDRGAATVFKLGSDEDWTARVPREGPRPLVVRLKRQQQ